MAGSLTGTGNPISTVYTKLVFLESSRLYTDNGSSNVELTTLASSMTFSGTITLSSIASGDGSGENFLVEDSGVIKKRSAAQVRSDLGIADAEIIDWTSDQGDTNIHAGNYTDTNTNQLTTFTLRDDDDDSFTIAQDKFVKVVATTGTLGTNITGSGSTGDPWVLTISSPDTDTTYTKASFDVDHLFTLVGAAADTSEDLGTFTGSTISDSRTIKQALQELETEVETKGVGDMTGVDLTGGTGISIDSETNTTSGAYSSTITCNLEGTEVVSTGETGGLKFLREDGDNTSSWQAPPILFSWGAAVRLFSVSAGDHVAMPSHYDGTTITLGNGTDPDTSYTTSTTADHINMRIIQFPSKMKVTSVIASYAQGGSTNTTHSLHLMRYDVDDDGDLSNGVVVGYKVNISSDDYSERRNNTLTLDATYTTITTSQCLVGTIEMVTAVNTYISCKFTAEMEKVE